MSEEDANRIAPRGDLQRFPVLRGRRLIHIFTVAGSADFLRGQARFMSQQGLEVHLVAAPDGDLLSRFASGENSTAHGLIMTRAITPLRDVVSLVHLLHLLSGLSPDVVHAGTPKGGFLGMVAAFLLGIPVRIYHIHGLRSATMNGWSRMLVSATERIACLLATRVLCVSHSTRETAVNSHLCPPEKILVLRAGSCNGVDALGRFNPALIDDAERTALRAALRIPPHAAILGYVGRVVREKGIVELVQAWLQLEVTFPELHLVVVGTVEEGDPVPEQWMERLKNHPRVRLVAAVAHPATYYALMDVVALPSYREGLPNVPLEAAAMGLPVVATRVSGSVDAVIDGQTGTLVPARTVEPLAEAIARYLLSPALRRAHGNNARERVLRDFEPEALWKSVAQLYQDELERSRR